MTGRAKMTGNATMTILSCWMVLYGPLWMVDDIFFCRFGVLKLHPIMTRLQFGLVYWLIMRCLQHPRQPVVHSLVEVNQAIKAWSFRSKCLFSTKNQDMSLLWTGDVGSESIYPTKYQYYNIPDIACPRSFQWRLGMEERCVGHKACGQHW